jgi:hypothetical protein
VGAAVSNGGGYPIYRVTRMGTKRSLIEVVHDEGYGDALLMHINHAFGTRDMRAERVLQSEPRLLAAALRTIATDVHNEVVRIGRGGRVDLETMEAWHKLADQVLAECSSSR